MFIFIYIFFFWFVVVFGKHINKWLRRRQLGHLGKRWEGFLGFLFLFFLFIFFFISISFCLLWWDSTYKDIYRDIYNFYIYLTLLDYRFFFFFFFFGIFLLELRLEIQKEITTALVFNKYSIYWKPKYILLLFLLLLMLLCASLNLLTDFYVVLLN